MRKWQIILLLMILTISPAFAADWVEIYPDIYMDASSYRYDPETERALVWMKLVNSQENPMESINGKRIEYHLMYNEFNCSGKQIQTLSSAIYDSKGKSLGSYEKPAYLDGHKNIIPDSAGEAWYQFACYPYLDKK